MIGEPATRRGIALTFVVVLALLLIASAEAHATLVRFEPPAVALLTTAPKALVLEFSEEIDAQQSSFTVTNGQRATVGQGKLDTTDLGHKTLSGTLDSGVGDDAYSVNWVAVTTDDNGKTEGSISFTVGLAQAQPTTTARPTTQPTTAGQPTAAAQPTAVARPTATPSNLPATGDSMESRTTWLPGASSIALLLSVLALRRALAHREGR